MSLEVVLTKAAKTDVLEAAKWKAAESAFDKALAQLAEKRGVAS